MTDRVCNECSAPLAPAQRYCVACGARLEELPFRPPERAAREPVAAGALFRSRSYGVVSAVVLASGVLIGAAVGPALTPTSLAATARSLVLLEDAPAPTTVAQGTGSSTSSPAGLSAPTGNISAKHHVVNLGGGPSAPAPAPAAPAPVAPPPAKPHTDEPPPADPTPATPDEQPSVAGTVVHISHQGKEYVLATAAGQLIAVHTKNDPPALGDKLKTTVKALDNGTFKELKPIAKGHADSAKFHGAVTFADETTYTVSARGVSMLVHLPPDVSPPATGISTKVTVSLTDVVTETERKDGDPVEGSLDLEAVIKDQDPAKPDQLIVSADDAEESEATLSLTIPPDLDTSKLTSGTTVSATVTRAEDGTLTLVDASADR